MLCLFASLLMALLVACTVSDDLEPNTAEFRQTVVSTFYYECDDQSRFVARVEDGHAWLFLESISINLPRRPSASGVKYQGADYLFWIKGEEALLETMAGKSLQCENNRAKAIWEAARLDGADFRAIGNEPGWLLLINAELLILDVDYGTKHYEFKMPEPEVDVEARLTRYRASEDGRDLVLELEGRPCHDSMSDEAFPTRVRIYLGERWLQGCGRPLH